MKENIQAIKTLIRFYKKDFDKIIQRSELLKRNKFFLEEYQGFKQRVGKLFFKVKNLDDKETITLKKDNILLKLDYPPVDYRKISHSKNININRYAKLYGDRYFKYALNLDIAIYNPPANIEEGILNKQEVLRRYINKWEDFCERWDIKCKWNGDIQNLEKYLREPVEIYRDNDLNILKFSYFIRINQWATIEDVRAKWSKVEKLQKEFWSRGKKEFRTNFGRDLIWHDLAKKYNLQPSQIAGIWIKNFPQDIELLIIRRFKKYIDNDDLGGRVLDDKLLLKEIKEGFLSDKYKCAFDEEKDYYITGRIKRGSKFVTVPKPLIDVIKKAVKRMEKQILEVSILPLPEEFSLFGIPRIGHLPLQKLG